MNTITETRDFAETPFRVFKILAPAGILFFLLTAILISVFGTPPAKNGKQFSPEGLIFIILAAEIVSFLIAFLACSFVRRRTVSCYPEGCDYSSTNFWNSFYETGSFRWNDVTDTNIVEEYVDRNKHSLFVDVDVRHQTKRLFSRHSSSKQDFNELVETINRMTPHLKYVWEQSADTGNRQVIVEVRSYSKVSRI